MVVAGWGTWVQGLRARVATLETELPALRSKFAAATAVSQKAQSLQPRLDLARGEAKLLLKEISSQGWAPALRNIQEGAGPGIALQTVRASGGATGAKTCELRVQGISIGADPRMVADQFRVTLQQRLEQQFRGAVTARFVQLEDEPRGEAASSSVHRAAFEISAIVVMSEPKAAIPEGK